jgi:hypothetical protein
MLGSGGTYIGLEEGKAEGVGRSETTPLRLLKGLLRSSDNRFEGQTFTYELGCESNVMRRFSVPLLKALPQFSL